MSDLISTDQLVALLEHVGGSRTAAEHMTIALRQRPAEYSRAFGGPATDILPTYRARRSHAKQARLRTEGLDEFIENLESQGSNEVALVTVTSEEWTTIGLLSGDLESAIACVAVEAGEQP